MNSGFRPSNSSFLGVHVSVHLAASGGGLTNVTDPRPTPVLASLLTVLLLHIFRVFDFFLHDSYFILNWLSCIFFVLESFFHFDDHSILEIIDFFLLFDSFNL